MAYHGKCDRKRSSELRKVNRKRNKAFSFRFFSLSGHLRRMFLFPRFKEDTSPLRGYDLPSGKIRDF